MEYSEWGFPTGSLYARRDMNHQKLIGWAVLLITGTIPFNSFSQENNLTGLWKCSQWLTKADPTPPCRRSVEFHTDGTMTTKGFNCGRYPPIGNQHRFKVTSNRINITDVKDGQQWYLDYEMLKNGELVLRKRGPCDFMGWFTKDQSVVPIDHSASVPLKEK